MSASDAKDEYESTDDFYELFSAFGLLDECGSDKVYKGQNRKTGEKVALKLVNESQAFHEARILKQLQHPHIVPFKGQYIEHPDRVVLVLELLDMNLSQVLAKEQGMLNLRTADNYLYQILLALGYCHSKGVMHCNLKPTNILVSRGVKLTNFGLARDNVPAEGWHETPVDVQEGNFLWYCTPPEILLGRKQYSASIDMWSFGTIFYEVVTGRSLFSGDTEMNQLLEICRLLCKLDTPAPTTDIVYELLRQDKLSSRESERNQVVHICCLLSKLYEPETARFLKSPPELTFFKKQIEKPRHPASHYTGKYPKKSTEKRRPATVSIDLLHRCLTYKPDERISAKDALDHEQFKSARMLRFLL